MRYPLCYSQALWVEEITALEINCITFNGRVHHPLGTSDTWSTEASVSTQETLYKENIVLPPASAPVQAVF